MSYTAGYFYIKPYRKPIVYEWYYMCFAVHTDIITWPSVWYGLSFMCVFWQLLSPPPLFVSPLHSVLFPTMLREHHHQDGRRYGGIWERSWLRPYSPSRGMVVGLHAFARTHEHKQNTPHQPVFGWLRDFAVLSFSGTPMPPAKPPVGGGRQLTMLTVLTLTPLLLLHSK